MIGSVLSKTWSIKGNTFLKAASVEICKGKKISIDKSVYYNNII